MADQGPPQVDMGAQLFARGITSGQGPTTADGKATSMDELVNKIFEASSLLVTKFTGVQVDKVFNTGAGANFKPGQALLDKSVNQAAQGFNVRGNILSNLTGDVFASARDFSKVQAPPLQGVEIGSAMNMSFDSLGDLRPMSTPGMGPDLGAGMSMNA